MTQMFQCQFWHLMSIMWLTSMCTQTHTHSHTQAKRSARAQHSNANQHIIFNIHKAKLFFLFLRSNIWSFSFVSNLKATITTCDCTSIGYVNEKPQTLIFASGNLCSTLQNNTAFCCMSVYETLNECIKACTIIACVWFGAVVRFINGAWFTVRAVTVWIHTHTQTQRERDV